MQTHTTARRFGFQHVGAALAALGIAAGIAIAVGLGVGVDSLPGRGEASTSERATGAAALDATTTDEILFQEQNDWEYAGGASADFAGVVRPRVTMEMLIFREQNIWGDSAPESDHPVYPEENR